MNIWKILTILLFIAALALTYVTYYGWDKEYELGGIKIKRSTLNDLSEAIDSDRFIICDIERNKCVTLGKIK